MPKDLAELLAVTIDKEIFALRALDPDRAAIRPAGPASWSPKEELGHLIDSAVNNHVRFVRAALEPEFRGPTYAQNDWVRLHAYQKMPWLEIVEYWFACNRFLTGLLAAIPEEKLATQCFIGTGAPVTLRFIAEDYVLHLQHHIDHALGRAYVTPYPAIPASKTAL